MSLTARSPGLLLAAGLATVLAAATAPAGLGGRPIPAASWLIWGAALLLAAGSAAAQVSVGGAQSLYIQPGARPAGMGDCCGVGRSLPSVCPFS